MLRADNERAWTTRGRVLILTLAAGLGLAAVSVPTLLPPDSGEPGGSAVGDEDRAVAIGFLLDTPRSPDVVDRSLIDEALDAASRRGLKDATDLERIDRAFEVAFAEAPDDFKHALVDARDTLGLYLARVWSGLEPDLHFNDILYGLLEADRTIQSGRFQYEITDAFARHGIR